jgi:hypothetical protein
MWMATVSNTYEELGLFYESMISSGFSNIEIIMVPLFFAAANNTIVNFCDIYFVFLHFSTVEIARSMCM